MAASEEKEYTVTITETKTWTVRIYASSSEEAKDLVEARHETCEHYDEVDHDIEFEAESEDEEEPIKYEITWLNGDSPEIYDSLDDAKAEIDNYRESHEMDYGLIRTVDGEDRGDWGEFSEDWEDEYMANVKTKHTIFKTFFDFP